MGCCFVGRDLSETLSWINLVGWNPLSRESCELIPSRGGVSTLTAVCGDYEWHVESCFLLRRKFTQFFMKAFFHPCLMVTSYQNHHMLKTNAIILYCSTSEEKNISNQYFLHFPSCQVTLRWLGYTGRRPDDYKATNLWSLLAQAVPFHCHICEHHDCRYCSLPGAWQWTSRVPYFYFFRVESYYFLC